MSSDQKFAVVFPGQGSQSLGMLADLYNKHTEVKDVFTEASSVLGYDLWDLSQTGPIEKLNTTEYTQPVLLAAGYAVWQVFCKHTDQRPELLAGHSLGEYSALAAAGAISFSDAIKLVAARGRFMQESVPANTGAMAAVLGLDNDKIKHIIANLDLNSGEDSTVELANLNAIGQTVIAGHKHSVLSCVDALKNNGAKIVKLLDVSVPSHCSLMQTAAENLNNLLDSVEISSPKIKVIHNYSIESYNSPEDIKQALVKQLTMPVRWVETVQEFSKSGIKYIYEFGPGSVLTKLTKRIDKSIKSISIDNAESLQELIKSFD